jgi:hypothetical protein
MSQYGTRMYVISRNVGVPDYWNLPLEPGDSSPETCLAAWETDARVNCIDVTAAFTYFPQEALLLRQRKLFRFSAIRGGRRGEELVWEQQPVNLNPSPCESYLTGDNLRFH